MKEVGEEEDTPEADDECLGEALRAALSPPTAEAAGVMARGRDFGVRMKSRNERVMRAQGRECV